MLKKEVCKHCLEGIVLPKLGDYRLAGFVQTAFYKRWDSGECFCFYNTNAKSFIVTKTNEEPPDFCHYVLEQKV